MVPEQYIPAQSESRSHCQTHVGCNFYSVCAEAKFHCGTNGFAMSYAKRRCAAIQRLRPVGNTPYSVSRAARRWARATETCFHTRLDALLTRSPNAHPDPLTCVDWEMEAIAELNKCYTEKSDDFLQLPEEDVRKLVKLFRISDYYSPAVDASLVELIKVRSTTLASEVVRNHTLSSRHRIVLCVKGTKYIGAREVTPSPQDYMRAVSSRLAPEESEYFHYAGPDQLENMDKVGGLCYDRSRSIDVNAYKNDYHLVTWFTTEHSRDDIQRIDIRYKPDTHIQVNVVMFELTTSEANNSHTQRAVTQCGDGMRQVSESCDFTNSYPGCTIDCEVKDGYDCSTAKLAPSLCWREVCGDGLRTRGEECDDGNDVDGDGCNNTCTIDHDTHRCSTVYNSTSSCVPIDSRQVLSQVPQPSPARLLSQTADSIDLSAADPTMGRTEFSSGYRPSSTILPIILGMVCTSILNLR